MNEWSKNTVFSCKRTFKHNVLWSKFASQISIDTQRFFTDTCKIWRFWKSKFRHLNKMSQPRSQGNIKLFWPKQSLLYNIFSSKWIEYFSTFQQRSWTYCSDCIIHSLLHIDWATFDWCGMWEGPTTASASHWETAQVPWNEQVGFSPEVSNDTRKSHLICGDMSVR